MSDFERQQSNLPSGESPTAVLIPTRLSDPREKAMSLLPLPKSKTYEFQRRGTIASPWLQAGSPDIGVRAPGVTERTPVRARLEKRKSVVVMHSPFPDSVKQEPLFPDLYPLGKSVTQIREDVSILKGLGVTTGDAVPAELNIYRERQGTKLVMSSFDLWGPQHAKQAMKKLGFYEAFKTMEGRDRRQSLRMENVLGERFNARIADDVSLMKALNTPMMSTSRSHPGFQPQYPLEKGKTLEVPNKAKALLSIIDSCDKLTRETRIYRKKLAPLDLKVEARVNARLRKADK